MKNRLQTQTLPRRTIRTFMAEGNAAAAPVPDGGHVTRADFDAFKNEVSEMVRNALQQAAQVTPQRLVAPSRTPEEQSLLQRMREMAD